MQTLVKADGQRSRLLDQDERWQTCHWYAIYTRSRHENFVANELEKKGLQSYLPVREVVRHWSDRKKIIKEPLFKSYVFVHLALKNRWEALNTKGVVRFVGPSAGVPTEVCEKDLLSIERFLKEHIQMDPFPYLKKGMRVYVRSGPFKGVEGFIMRKNEHCRLVVSLDALMQSISVEIDQACVELI